MISNQFILNNMLFGEIPDNACPTLVNCDILTANDIKIILYLVEHFLDDSEQKNPCTIYQFDKIVISKETGVQIDELSKSLNRISEIELHSPNSSLVKNNRENLLNELIFDEDEVSQFIVLDLSRFVYDSLMGVTSLSNTDNNYHHH